MLNTAQPAWLPIILVCFLMLLGVRSGLADVWSIDIPAKAVPEHPTFSLGTPRSPTGQTITADALSLYRDGKRWLPAMGEIHFSRYPASEWRDELLKMKAGGLDSVATYVFWNHHEEEQGKFDWSGQRNLREFALACKDVGIPMIARIGPWCHGEVRNGGIPDWVVAAGRARSDDPAYMEKVKALYSQIAEQLKGLLWKDGGPVMGIQLENESRNGRHMTNLKNLAKELGLDVPIYTRTGWPGLNANSPVPYPEILPLYGAYAEGFWDRSINFMPGNYWQAFVLRDERIDTNIAQDQQGRGQGEQQRYPYLTCELGGGMMTSYHRRILIDPRDVDAVATVKLGSGGNMLGYYMYHGGTNPPGKLSTLNEHQGTPMTNDNDMPVLTYDFQAPLGEFGQVRPHYHMLRRLHMFLGDFGESLATMDAHFPQARVRSRTDAETPRWSIRTEGQSGYLFVNNFQRLLPMPARDKTQFEIKLAGGESRQGGLGGRAMKIPTSPVNIPPDAYFIWPFNLTLGPAKLIHATAQPLCRIEDGGTTYAVFMQSNGIPAEFAFDPRGITVESTGGKSETTGGATLITGLTPGTGAAIRLRGEDGKRVCIVLVDETTSMQVSRAKIGGVERILLSKANVLVDGETLRLQSSNSADFTVAALPMLQVFPTGSADPMITDDGIFKRIRIPMPAAQPLTATVEPIKPAGPPRELRNGVRTVLAQPTDADFDQAAVFRIKLPAGIDPKRDVLLKTTYHGDVARYYLDNQFLTDNFYNGTTFDLGLKRTGAQAYTGELTVKVLPMKKDAPLYLNEPAKIDFGSADSIAKIIKVELVETREVRIAVR